MRKTSVLFLAGLLWATVVHAFPNSPVINSANVFVITNSPFNAVGDGVVTNTAAIQAAINAATAASGGGIVEIPGPGIYLCGPLTMKTKVNIQIDTNATLRLLPRAKYPGSPGSRADFCSASSINDLEFSGTGGIDGQGWDWWFNKTETGALTTLFFTTCKRVWIKDITISNSPAFNIAFKGSGDGDILIERIKIFNPSSHDPSLPSHNTDGIDLIGTNCVVRDCAISTGDDNIALGSSSSGAVSANTIVTNCTFGEGHGLSIGSNTKGTVSNLTVIDCTYNNTEYGIRMKSDNASANPGSGGMVQNLAYYNLGMTNLRYAAVLIYSYYNVDSSPSAITASVAASETIPSPIPTTTVSWRNIVISNVTATVASGNGSQAAAIWGRTEWPVTNITIIKMTNASFGTFGIYNVKGCQIIDSQINVSGGAKTYSLFQAQVTVSNSAPGAGAVTFDGLASSNSLALYNAPASLGEASVFGANPITLNNSILTDTTALTLPASNVVNFALGSNVAKIAVTGNLILHNTNNISDGGGFGPGVYTLYTYTGGFLGPAVLGSTPGGGLTYSITNGAGKVNLVVATPCVNPTANVSGSGTICSGDSANIQAALTGTQPWTVTWSDGFVQSGVSSSPAMRSVSPTVTSNYTVTALSDFTGCPAGTLSGGALVTVNAHPTANVTGGGTICGGGSANVQAALGGSQPWTVTWSDGFVQSGVSTSPAMRNVSPSVNSNYTVTALSDATGCSAGTSSGGALVTVNAHPTANVSGGGTICSGDSANIQAALAGSQPWTVTWSDGFVQSGVSASPASRSVSPTVTSNYTVTALTDATGCTAGTLGGSALVTVNDHPTANVSGGGVVCNGSSVNIQADLTGTQPWDVTWSDGFVQSGVTTSPATRSVSPGSDTNYTVTALSDATGCTAGSLSGNASVTVCENTPLQITSVFFLAPDQFVLTWSSVSNLVYDVLSQDDLGTGPWVTNATVTAASPSTSWTNSGLSGVPRRAYRVVQP